MTRWMIGAAMLAAALGARADFEFPPVAVYQKMHAVFTVTSTAGPVGGIPVTLTVPSGCGTVTPAQVTTDSAGTGQFDFFASDKPGVCLIAGSAMGTTLYGRTTIYIPTDVSLTAPTLLREVRPGEVAEYAFEVRAGGVPLASVPITVGPAPAPGPVIPGGVFQVVTNPEGKAIARLRAGDASGVFDVPVRVLGLERRVRLVQRQTADPDPPAPNALRASGNPWDDVVVALENQVAPCRVNRARLQDPDLSAFLLPTDLPEAASGYFEVSLFLCRGINAQLRFDYPKDVPAGTVAWQREYREGTGFSWKRIAARIEGKSIRITAADGSPQDLAPGDKDTFLTQVAFGMPGPAPRPAAPRVEDLWWSGIAENGWGMSISQSEYGTLFSAIYAYDAQGEPTWWVMSDGDWFTAREKRYVASAYSAYGTPWYAFDGALTYVGAPAGKLELTFQDSGHALMQYTINGVSGTKAIERMMFGPPAASPRSGVGDLWWGGPSQNGWGIAVIQQEATLFSVWYTYDANNKPIWYVMPGGGWSSPDTYEGRIYRTRGSPWLGVAYDPSKLQTIDVGAFKLKFGEHTATFDYNLEGRGGRLDLERMGY